MPATALSFATPRRQLFAFPLDVISSMLENPSSHKGLSKLYQTCKYFYGKRPILIADNVSFKKCKDKRGNQILCAGFSIKNVFRNISHLHTPIWLTNTTEMSCIHSLRLPKFYRYSVQNILLSKSALYYDDFILLTAEKNVECITFFCKSYVYHSDMSLAAIEEVLPHLPKIDEFTYYINERCSVEILGKLNEIKRDKKLSAITLYIHDIHPTFHLNLFSEFIMKNSNTDSNIRIYEFQTATGKLKIPLQKLDPKWRNEAYAGLKEFYRRIDPNWGV